jgi:hypothetical protein
MSSVCSELFESLYGTDGMCWEEVVDVMFREEVRMHDEAVCLAGLRSDLQCSGKIPGVKNASITTKIHPATGYVFNGLYSFFEASYISNPSITASSLAITLITTSQISARFLYRKRPNAMRLQCNANSKRYLKDS